MLKSIYAFIVLVSTLAVAVIIVARMIGEVIVDHIRGIDR